MAIEQLQAELTASRKEEQAVRDEAQRVRLRCVTLVLLGLLLMPVLHCTTTLNRIPQRAAAAPQICDEQAAELRRAEEHLQQTEAALAARNQQVSVLQAKAAELEAELEGARHEHRTFGSVFAAKERDQARRLETLQDEVEHQREKVAELERLLKERGAAAADQRARALSLQGDLDGAERASRDLGARAKALADERQRLETQLAAATEEAAALRRQANEAAALAEQRAAERAAADKEWGRRLAERDREFAARAAELEGKAAAGDERSEQPAVGSSNRVPGIARACCFTRPQ